MIGILWNLARGYRLRPWRSPYLRWRIETYWGLHADRITFRQFWAFLWNERGNLLRYLRWASRMKAPRTTQVEPRHGWQSIDAGSQSSASR